MSDLEPGVTLSPGTIAAMERLSTPSRTSMTKPHRATPEQWETIEKYADTISYSCILELRARIEALEAGSTAVNLEALAVADRAVAVSDHDKKGWRDRLFVKTETTYGDARAAAKQILCAPLVVEGTFEHGGETYRFKAKPERETAMDEPREASLVERVADAITAQATSTGIVNDRPARAAILVVVAWLREYNINGSAAALEKEVGPTTNQEDYDRD